MPTVHSLAKLASRLSGHLTVMAMVSIAFSSQGFAARLAATDSKGSAIRLEGFSEGERTRLMGFLRAAAYGPNVPGAMKISSQLLGPSSSGRGNTNSVRANNASTAEDDNGCFFTIPDRFRVFKKLPAQDPCIDQGTSVVADTDSQILFLCKDGKTVKDFDFAMGWSGTGKRKEGDEKTPLGVYSLASPRRSGDGFYKFIGVGYPTAMQKDNGFTGSAVGIHGPSRWGRCLGFLNATFNWTNGCLAVMSDSQIDEISSFVTTNKAKRIVILPLEETGLK